MGNVVVNPYIFGNNTSWAAWDGSADGSNQNLTTITSGSLSPAIVKLDSSRIAAIYARSMEVVIQVGTIAGTSITWGSAQFIQGSGPTIDGALNAILIDTDKIFVYYTSDSGLAHIQGCVVTISGTTPSPGTLTSILPGLGTSSDSVALTATALTPTTVFVSYRITSGGFSTNGVILSVSGTMISVGTPAIIISSGSTPAPSVAMYAIGKILMSYQNNSGEPEAQIINYSNTTIGTIGPLVTFESGATVLGNTNMVTPIDVSTALWVCADSSAGGGGTGMKAMVLTLSGDTITTHTRFTLVSFGVDQLWVSSLNSTQFMITYRKFSSSVLYGMVLTISATNIIASSEVTIQASSSNGTPPQNITMSNDICAMSAVVSTTAVVQLLKRS